MTIDESTGAKRRCASTTALVVLVRKAVRVLPEPYGISRLAFLVPLTAGVKLTSTVQLAPGARVALQELAPIVNSVGFTPPKAMEASGRMPAEWLVMMKG